MAESETRDADGTGRPRQAAAPAVAPECCLKNCRNCARRQATVQRGCTSLSTAEAIILGGSAIRVREKAVNLMNDPLQWVCERGHYWYAPVVRIRDDGMLCPHCPPPKNIIVCRVRRILEHCWRPIEFEQKIVGGIELQRYQLTSPETPFPYARPAFLQREGIPQRAQELDGYNEALGIAFEVQTDTDSLAEQLSQVKAKRCRAHRVHLLVIPFGVEPGPCIRAQLQASGHYVQLGAKPIINRRTAIDAVD
jgi:hypothetical protein